MQLRRAQLLLAALLAIAGTAVGRARPPSPEPSLESRVRAAFVFNFIQFVDWPEASLAKGDDPIVIGVVDPDPLEGCLATAIEGKTVKGHRLSIRRVTAEEVGSCHVLVVGSANAGKSAEILKQVKEASVLTIGDYEAFTESGGVVRFYVDDRKERFEINVAAARRAGLQISSKLLKLAKVVNK
jgi:hypothetical protein